jgi:hypothetical protein
MPPLKITVISWLSDKPVSSAPRRLTFKDCEFKARLNYITSSKPAWATK